MQRINTLKWQSPAYQDQNLNKNVLTANSDGTNLMQIKSNVNDNVISLHLEFTEDSTGIGEEIRDTLKEKYLLKLGSMQMESSAIQSSSQEGEMEDNA